MRSKAAIEIESAKNILRSALDDWREIDERWWIPSKRGSNAGRLFASIKAKLETALQCTMDAESNSDDAPTPAKSTAGAKETARQGTES